MNSCRGGVRGESRGVRSGEGFGRAEGFNTLLNRSGRVAVMLSLCVAAGLFLKSAARAEDKPEEKKPAQSIKMEFKEAALDTVLEQLSDSTGLVIVKGESIEGKITIISKQAMTTDEAIALLNTVLKEKGYVGIRTGKILKIVRLEEAKKRNIPVRTGTDPEKVEANDEVHTQVIQIKYVDAVQLKKDFLPLIPSYAELTANSASNTLMLTDTGANIKRIMEMIRSIDTQTSTVSEVKVFQLKYANATSAARLITDLFKPETSTGQQGGGGGASNFFSRFRGGGGGGPPGFGAPSGGDTNAGGDSGGSHKMQKVSASADDRTNTVVVSAAAETLKVIEGIIKELDSNPAEEQAVFIYRCKNAQARNLEGVLNSLFGTTGTTGSRSTTTNRNNNTGRGTGVTRNGSTGGSGFGSGGTGSSGFGSSGGTSLPGFNQGGTTGGTSGGGGRNTGSVSGDLTGQVYVVADLDTNSLMVLTPTKNFERVKSVLTDLDKPVPQVIIKVLIAEVTHEKSTDVGTDTSVLASGAVKSVLTDFGVAAQTTGLITKVVQNDISVALRALATEGKLEVLSRPYIICSDNQQSSITVGQEVPFIVSSRTTDTGQTVNTIQYQDIGIILNVTAHINEDGLVIMDVAPEVSSLTGTTVPISETVNAPVFAKRSAISRVGVMDGQTVVIGGLMEDKKTENNQGVPVLRKIPGLGLLFGRKTNDKSKTELVIFLTPHVAQNPYMLKPMSEQEMEGLKVVPNAVKPGTYWEHRQGLERGNVTILPPEGSDNGIRIETPVAPPVVPAPMPPPTPPMPPPVVPQQAPPARGEGRK